LKKKGVFKTQVINKYSLRGLYNLFRIKYRKKEMIRKGMIDNLEGENSFTVRYFSLFKTFKIYNKFFFIEKINNYSFFTQAQQSDFKMLSLKSKFFLSIAGTFNFISKYIFFLKYFSDNLILILKKK
jgi:hypothetical protein